MLTLHFFPRWLGSAEYLLPGVIAARWCPYDSDPPGQTVRYSFAHKLTRAPAHPPPTLPHYAITPRSSPPARTASAGLQCSNSDLWLCCQAQMASGSPCMSVQCTVCTMGWILELHNKLKLSMHWWGLTSQVKSHWIYLFHIKMYTLLPIC